MTATITHQLVDGLETIGRSCYLQVFSAPNGIALLDWVPEEHRVLSLWVHPHGIDLRLGSSIHVVLAPSPLDVDHLLGILREALVDGAWHETYAIDPATGEVEAISWRIGSGTDALHSLPRAARPAGEGLRVRRRGGRWGPPPTSPDLEGPRARPMLDRFGSGPPDPGEAPIV